MKVSLITPWQNAWVPYFERLVKARGHDFRVFEKQAPIDSDVVIHGWAIGTPSVTRARNIVFLRRYELFEGGLGRIDWSSTSALICVNSWLRDIAEQILRENKIETPVHLIYNGLDLSKWTFAEHKPGKKIGMACFIHSKKNLPLAIQILAALPEGYELHIAGGVQDPCLAEYMNHVANKLGKVLHVYGQIPSSQLDKWWDGMDYCLSTSVSEGNPNNVIEAMAKGIKPVVHCWPGADDQFPGHIFRSVDEAVQMILSDDYDPRAYQQAVQAKFSLRNLEQVLDLALEPMKEAA